ncbi:hypothetical protein BGZ60DRAFT_236456 [Tricladium varicosporioides]|nr:hypothetical protein BGZ60DRAFT_236456 [Hymenoscyphus varicosporioides]
MARIAGEVRSSDMTLRFKHGKQTILIFADPLDTFETITSELLEALHERYPEGLPTDDPGTFLEIPSDFNQVVLAGPNDPYDNSQGWKTLVRDEGNVDENLMDESPRSMSIKDGGMIAFAFKAKGTTIPEFRVEFSNVDELYPDEE